jgi:exo-beta-1,3-glucanase (GH17 family)
MTIKSIIKGAIILLMISIITIISGCQSKNSREKSMSTSTQENTESIQEKSALLAGFADAICYSGFRSGQHPDRGEGAKNPSYEETLEDLTILKEQTPFRLMRVYDSGENSEMVLRVIKENNLDFKVMLGMWLQAELSAHETCEWLLEPIPQEELDENKIENAEEIQRGIQLANAYPEIIAAVNVGNEALVEWNDHKVSVDSVISYVKQVQKAIKQPVTVADNYKWWADHGKELAAVVDFVSIHLYPIWENRDIDEGMSYSIANVEEVMNTLPGAQIVIAEAGWTTIASEFGPRASQEKQKRYIGELMDWSRKNNITTFIFEAFDEDWKGDPNDPMGAEKHWGLYTVDRKPKIVIEHFSQSK